MNNIYIIAIAVFAGLCIVFIIKHVRKKISATNIDQTKITIDSIKKIAEWAFVKEVIERYDIEERERELIGTKKLVLITQSKIRAGYDFAGFNDKDITIDGKTLHIRLPQVKTLSVISNPDDYEIYDFTGKWSDEEVKNIKISAKEKNRCTAEEEDRILDKAEELGRKRLKGVFEALGFEQVIFEDSQITPKAQIALKS